MVEADRVSNRRHHSSTRLRRNQNTSRPDVPGPACRLTSRFDSLHQRLATAKSDDVQAPTRRIPSLDGLRAISILMVLFSHATHTLNFPPWLIKRASTFIVGALGVRVFFVISGYLTTTLLLKEAKREGRISLSEFYQRRVFRILPVYFFYIFTVLLVVGWLGLNAIYAPTYLSAFAFMTHLWGPWSSESWPLMHSWSLAIEEQFYLIWPAMLVFLGPGIGGKIWVPSLILMAPVLRFLFSDGPLIDQIFLTQGDSIAFGGLLALAFSRRETQTQCASSSSIRIGDAWRPSF